MGSPTVNLRRCREGCLICGIMNYSFIVGTVMIESYASFIHDCHVPNIFTLLYLQIGFAGECIDYLQLTS